MDDIDTQVSLKQLKENLRSALKQSGCLTNVKAQIRKEFIQSITGTGPSILSKTRLVESDSLNSSKRPGDLHDRVVYSLIYNYLSGRKLVNTLSVYVAEYGSYDTKSFLLSPIDIIATLQLGSSSAVYKEVMNHELKPAADSSTNSPNFQSVLDLLIQHSFSNINRRVETSTQTDGSGYTATELVDLQLKDIRANYLKRRADDRSNPLRTVEERMIIFERECEERYRRDLEMQMAYFRDNEAAKVRLEERQKARHEFDLLKRELEGDFKYRLDNHRDREIELNKRAEEKERHFQQLLFDARQKMQQEIDDLRNQEQLITRKLEIESQSLRVLESRLKESQTALEVREHDVARREREVVENTKTLNLKSKEEARANVRLEMDAIMTDRTALILERQRFEEEKGFHTSLIENAKLARQQLQETQNSLLLREDELASYKRRFEQLELRKAEELDMKGKPGYSTNLVTLIHRNAELEARLRDREDSNFLAKNEEVHRLQLRLKELQCESESDRKNHEKQSELLKHEIQLERSRVQSLQIKSQDLEKQNHEYKNLLSKLQSVYKHEDRSKISKERDHAKRISNLVEEAIGPSSSTISKYSSRIPLRNDDVRSKEITSNSKAWNDVIPYQQSYDSRYANMMMPYSQIPMPMSMPMPNYLNAYPQSLQYGFPPDVRQIMPGNPSIPYQPLPHNNIPQYPPNVQSEVMNATPLMNQHESIRIKAYKTATNQTHGDVKGQAMYTNPSSMPPDVSLYIPTSDDKENGYDKKENEAIAQHKVDPFDHSQMKDSIANKVSKVSNPMQISSHNELVINRDRVDMSQNEMHDGDKVHPPRETYRQTSIGPGQDLREHEIAVPSKSTESALINDMNSIPFKVQMDDIHDGVDGNLSSKEIVSQSADKTSNEMNTKNIEMIAKDNHVHDDLELPKQSLSPSNRNQNSNDNSKSDIDKPLDLEASKKDDQTIKTIESRDHNEEMSESKRPEEDKDMIESNENIVDLQRQAEINEQRRQEEDRIAIIEARQKVLERRNKRFQSSFDSVAMSSIDDRPLTGSISSANQFLSTRDTLPLSSRSSVQSSVPSITEYNENEVESVSDEFETPQGQDDAASDSDDGWY